MHSASARPDSAAAHRDAHAQDGDDAGIAGGRAGRSHLQDLHRRRDHDPRRAGEIQLHLRCRKDSQAEAEARVEELAEKIEDELGDAIFSRKGETIEQIVSYLLQMRGMTLATAESCTGGMLAERITSLSGSSRYFLGGAVVYSNELKTQFANVPKALIDQHGAVSREVAQAMAEGIRKRCLSSYGVGITGVAGPSGGTEQKPVGLVYIALAGEEGTQVVERNFPGDRKRIRQFATQQALEMIRRALL